MREQLHVDPAEPRRARRRRSRRARPSLRPRLSLRRRVGEQRDRSAIRAITSRSSRACRRRSSSINRAATSRASSCAARSCATIPISSTCTTSSPAICAKSADSQEALDAYREAIRRSPQLLDSMAIEIAKLELDIGNLAGRGAQREAGHEAQSVRGAFDLRGDRDGEEAARSSRSAKRVKRSGREDRPRVPALLMLARVLVEREAFDEALDVADRAAARVREDGAHSVATLQSTRGDILARMGRSAGRRGRVSRRDQGLPADDRGVRATRAAAGDRSIASTRSGRRSNRWSRRRPFPRRTCSPRA